MNAVFDTGRVDFEVLHDQWTDAALMEVRCLDRLRVREGGKLGEKEDEAGDQVRKHLEVFRVF